MDPMFIPLTVPSSDTQHIQEVHAVLIHLVWGVPTEGKMPLITAIRDGTPAAAAGLQPGDEIVSVAGQGVKETTEVAPLISHSSKKPSLARRHRRSA